MKYIILLRHPNKSLTFIQEDEYTIMEFHSEQEAEDFISDNLVCQAWLTQIVEVDI